MTTNTKAENDVDSEKAFKALMKSWNLEHISDFLLSEKININILKIIKQHHIEMLFKSQKIGDLVLFEHNLGQWRKSCSSFVQEEKPITGTQNSIHLSNSISIASSSCSSRGPPTANDSVNLEDILNDCRKSKIVKEHYEANSKLLDDHRNILIGLICNYFEVNNQHMSLATSYRLEAEILKRFPTERAEYYRVGKRGKIYTKYCNAKNSFRALLKRSSSAVAPDGEPSRKVGSMKLTPEDDAEECIRSLKHDKLSAAEFDSRWQSCSQFRLQEIREAGSLSDIFAKWPEYKSPSGYRFIDKDFGVIFGNCPGLLSRWPEQCDIFRDFLLRENHIRDKGMREMLQRIDQNDIKSDNAALKLMWCLHAYLFPTQKAVKKDNSGKNIVIKFTIKSSQEAFIFGGTSVQEMDDHVTFLKDKCKQVKPFVLALVDKDFNSFKQFYVYIDGIKFKFNNFLRAVDICFKCFHLFNLEYPLPCLQFWAFIERHFYDINVTKNATKMFVLSEELKKIRKS